MRTAPQGLVEESKTSFLSAQARKWGAEYGFGSLVVCSFTRAAAAEIAGRGLPLQRDQIATLHSLGFRALGLTREDVAEGHIVDWNLDHPEHLLTVPKESPDASDMASGAHSGDASADTLMRQAQVLRAQMRNIEWWPESVADFHTTWSEWCTERELTDFTGFIERALHETDHAPGNPKVGLFDEAQDFTLLEITLVRAWAEQMDIVLYALDDDQCQPGHATVLTAKHGYVRMDELDPAVHRLVSCSLTGGSPYLNGFRQGHAFDIAKHAENADGLTVDVDGARTECTNGHHWHAKIDPVAAKKCVVYLMRKGNWWRVGWCQLTRADGVFHLGARARNERADAAYVLDVFDERAHASMHESIVAARYGISTAPFHPAVKAGLYTRETLDGIFTSLEDVMEERATRALADHGRDVRYPIWSPGSRPRSGKSVERIHACNLLPGVHLVPKWGGGDGRDVLWFPIEVTGRPYVGDAYSLAVEPHKTYVTDGGIVTGNCLYAFKGVTPGVFLDHPIDDAHKKVLSQSYRVPRAVHAVATEWIEQVAHREPKEYKPRDADGVFDHAAHIGVHNVIGLVDDIEEAKGTVMVLGTNRYVVRTVIAELRRRGIVYWNPYTKRGEWNPIKLGSAGKRTSVDKLLAFLRPDPNVWGDRHRLWNYGEMHAWLDLLTKKNLVQRHGMRWLTEQPPGKQVDMGAVHDNVWVDASADVVIALEDLDLDMFDDLLTTSASAPLKYPLAVARTSGARTLLETPTVVTGSIHSAKGAEADVVFLLPDLSAPAWQQWVDEETKDEIVRLFYVGMTRARERLVLCGGTGRRVSFGNMSWA